jgi:glucose-6-phosphate 1-dehydrogenase
MVPNHMFQILCLIAMEPPVSFDADEVRSKKVDVLRAVRPIPLDRVSAVAVRGQYGAGTVEGKTVPGYRQEPGVAPDSNTETFAALKLYVDNWRWQGVPFYLRTGKRLPARDTEVDIQFRAVPHRSFPSSAVEDWRPNRLVVHVQPDEGILLRFQAKRPGPRLQLGPVTMRFSYEETFHASPPDAYETLLLDALEGDATLFMRADQVETAWEVIASIQQAWENTPAPEFQNYGAGSWGPKQAEELIERDGRRWLLPTHLEKPEQDQPGSTGEGASVPQSADALSTSGAPGK